MPVHPIQRSAQLQLSAVSIAGQRSEQRRGEISEVCVFPSARFAALHERVERLRAESVGALFKRRRAATQRPPVLHASFDESVTSPMDSWVWLFTIQQACPNCRSRFFHRSHRRNRLEFGMSRIALPFRCDECNTRFFLIVL
jgi:hypothetical protein